MCGIIGGTNKNWKFQDAVDCLKHRGPDSQKIIYDDNLSLGFARLAIIDLSHEADQPMSDEHDAVRIVFNGEIYNFKSLRQDLMAKGHHFRSHSDTEVLLKAYLQWNDQFVDHIDGMFAIAIYDLRTQQLKLLRDRPGIKPLYYYLTKNQIAFASELKGLTVLCETMNWNYDYTAILDYLTYYYIPAPKTLYKQVFKLPPAHQLTYDLKKREVLSLKPFWSLNIPPEPISITPEQACLRTRELIRESVKDQLVADVPVGIFSSGGIDSSVLVAEASTLAKEVKTFSIGFDDPSFDETPYAQEISVSFKTRHFKKKLSYEYTSRLIKRIKDWYDEPFADTSAYPTYLVSEFAKKNVTVALAGDGGDEIFGGYTRYKTFADSFCQWPFSHRGLHDRLSKYKTGLNTKTFYRRIINYLEFLTGDPIERYAMLMGSLTPRQKDVYAERWGIPKNYDHYWHFRQFYRQDLPIITRMQYLDFHTYLPGDILTKVDRVSMAVSLEVRVPLLSKKIVEYSFSLPQNIRLLNGQLKGILKQAYKKILPITILNRPKKGFAIPSAFLNLNNEYPHQKILREFFHIT